MHNTSIETYPVISLYGTDGSGKTTIADKYAQISNENVMVIGASDYKNWLSYDIYSECIGNTQLIHDAYTNAMAPEQKNEFYEDIAICALYIAYSHASNKGPSVIHSDGYFKRLIWSLNSMPNETFWNYADSFDAKVYKYIGNIFASHVVVIDTTAEDCLNNMIDRGINSEFDPTNIEETIKMHAKAEYVKDNVLLSRKYERLNSVDLISVSNSRVEQCEIDAHITSITNYLLDNTGNR